MQITRLVAAAAVVLAAGTGCSSEERRAAACAGADEVSLCVSADGTTHNVRRLADSAARRDPAAAANRAARLVALPVPDGTVELSVQPTQPVKLVEVALHRSVRVLGREPPIESAECATTTCGRWPTTRSGERRTVRVPARDIQPGNVLVVASFVETPASVQQISWGVVFRTSK